MEILSAKEFFEKLNSGNLKPTFGLKGIVKKSEKADEVLFAKKGDWFRWIAIPASAIESVRVIKTFIKEDETYSFVKIHLKTPNSSEGKTLLELLKDCSCPCHKQGYDWHSHRESGCNCGCHHHGHDSYQHGCSCGCHHSHCNCGCHQSHCDCGCHHPQSGCGCHPSQ